MVLLLLSYYYLHRYLFKHIIQSYLPTTMIVIVSWLSFMIPPESFPGRSGMLVLLVLVIINIMLVIIGQSPVVSGICGLTIWSMLCLFMVIMRQNNFTRIRAYISLKIYGRYYFSDGTFSLYRYRYLYLSMQLFSFVCDLKPNSSW